MIKVLIVQTVIPPALDVLEVLSNVKSVLPDTLKLGLSVSKDASKVNILIETLENVNSVEMDVNNVQANSTVKPAIIQSTFPLTEFVKEHVHLVLS